MAEMPRPETFHQAQEIDAPVAIETSTRIGSRGRQVKRILLAAALLFGTAFGGYYGHEYWTAGRFMVDTDDAYVKADSTIVAPKVSGYIAAVAVQDNQPVLGSALVIALLASLMLRKADHLDAGGSH